MAKAEAILATRNFQDLTGRRFGRYLALSEVDVCRHGLRWKCRCDCGTERMVLARNLLRGTSQSCGCLHCENTRKKFRRHGLCKSPTWQAWKNMKQRCQNESHPLFKYYGQRGIRVCERWLGTDGFDNFLADMGKRPSPEKTLERIDVNGNYEPGNCRWATMLEQGQNRRNSRLVEYKGRTQTASAWARELGLHPSVVIARLDIGWTVEQSLETPVGSRKKP